MAILQAELDAIQNRDWWVVLLPMMQKHWALAETSAQGTFVYFVDDLGGVFDVLPCQDHKAAVTHLSKLGFEPYGESPRLRRFLRPPERPLNCETTRESPIYSGAGTDGETERLK